MSVVEPRRLPRFVRLSPGGKQELGRELCTYVQRVHTLLSQRGVFSPRLMEFLKVGLWRFLFFSYLIPTDHALDKIDHLDPIYSDMICCAGCVFIQSVQIQPRPKKMYQIRQIARLPPGNMEL